MRSFSYISKLNGFAIAGLLSQYKINCDDSEDNSLPSLVKQADDAIEAAKAKIKTPLQFEQLKQTISSQGAQSFDGFRCAVQKQVNLNTVVSHFYWLGSQAVGQPIYQYRLILHEDDKMINVATDLDMNMEGDMKMPLAPQANFKSSFVLQEQTKSLTANIDYTSDSFTSQIEFHSGAGTSLGASYVQALTPTISLGGSGKYIFGKGIFKSMYGGVFDDGENMGVAVWDHQVQLLYLRRVNKNRVHLASQLLIDETGKGQMSTSAEFILKQSKINLAIDSDLMIKSSMETAVAPGMTMQLAAELQHFSNHYRFGYGLVIG